MKRQHGDIDTCIWCGQPVVWDEDEKNKGAWQKDGDYGCDSSPVTSEEGAGRHNAADDPMIRSAEFSLHALTLLDPVLKALSETRVGDATLFEHLSQVIPTRTINTAVRAHELALRWASGRGRIESAKFPF